MSTDRQNIRTTWVIGVAVSNSGVRTLTGRTEMVDYAHAQYKFRPKQPRTNGAMSRGPQVAMRRNCAIFKLV